MSEEKEKIDTTEENTMSCPKSFKTVITLKSEQTVITHPIIGYKESCPENVGNFGTITDSYIDIMIPYALSDSDKANDISGDTVKDIIEDLYGYDEAIRFYKDIFTEIILTKYTTSSDGTQTEEVLEHITGKEYILDRVYNELVSNEFTNYEPGLITHICIFNKTDINKIWRQMKHE